MYNLEKFFKDNFIEGKRFDLVNRLAGSCAVLGVPIEECISFYKKFKYLDDENREKLIRRTYDKFFEGQTLQTLKPYNVDVSGYFGVDNNSVTYNTRFNLNFLDNFLSKSNNNIINLDEVSIPFNFKFHLRYLEYLNKRKIDLEEIHKYNIRIGKDKYSDRIIFPIFNKNNECIFFTARSIDDNIQPRYLNSKTSKEYIIWNFYNIDYKKPVVVCEGIINSITVMKYTKFQSIATLSKILTQGQIEMLSIIDTIIFAFDGDVDKSYYHTLLNKLPHNKIYYIELPKNKDINDLTTREIRLCFSSIKRLVKEDRYGGILNV